MISYAQNREDVLLNRFFSGDSPQFYVDVGAGHPVFHSVTKHFYDTGWRGLNVEPRTFLLEQLVSSRPRDINKNCAVAHANGKMKFYEVQVLNDKSEDNGGLSTLDSHLADNYRKLGYSVQEHVRPVLTLTQLLADAGVVDIGFLKIDAEGFEMSVIQSLNWERWRPRVVVTESTKPTTSEVCDGGTREFLCQRGYQDVFFDGLNRYYVRNEDRDRMDRLCVPANVLDAFDTYEHYQLRSENVRIRSQLNMLEDHVRELEDESSSFTEIEILIRQNQALAKRFSELYTQLAVQREAAQRRTLRGRWRQAKEKIGIYMSDNGKRNSAA